MKTLPDEKKKEACTDWHQKAVGRPKIGEASSREDIERKAEWIESTLTGILDRHATQIRVTAGSKRWWTLEMETKR